MTIFEALDLIDKIICKLFSFKKKTRAGENTTLNEIYFNFVFWMCQFVRQIETGMKTNDLKR